MLQAYLSEGSGDVRNCTLFACSSQSNPQVTPGSAAPVALELGKHAYDTWRQGQDDGRGHGHIPSSARRQVVHCRFVAFTARANTLSDLASIFARFAVIVRFVGLEGNQAIFVRKADAG